MQGSWEDGVVGGDTKTTPFVFFSCSFISKAHHARLRSSPCRTIEPPGCVCARLFSPPKKRHERLVRPAISLLKMIDEEIFGN